MEFICDWWKSLTSTAQLVRHWSEQRALHLKWLRDFHT